MDKPHCANEVTAAAHFTLSLSLTLVQKKEEKERKCSTEGQDMACAEINCRHTPRSLPLA